MGYTDGYAHPSESPVFPLFPMAARALHRLTGIPAVYAVLGLANAFGWMVGTTAGSGMALQLVLTGVLYVVVAVVTYLFIPHVRNLEAELPDHDQMRKLEKQ